MQRSVYGRVPALIALVFAFTLTTLAQDFRATLTGRVTDSNGAAVSGAQVTITNSQTNIESTATTNEEGNYTVPFLQPGDYRVTVGATGFATTVNDVLTLFTASTRTFDVALEVGGLDQTVVVTADASIIDADTASRGQVIENARINELPLVGRNPLNLATLAPGVTFNGNPQFNRPFDNGDNVNFSINGGLNRHNEFLLDGAPNNANTDANASRTVSSNNIAFVPSAEATEEFKIQTNTYDSQFGRTGGGTINITIKAGGSDFHGSVYEFARRYQLDANRFSNNARGTFASGPFVGQEVSPRFGRDQTTGENLGGPKIDQYGFVVSGPVLLPNFGEGGPVFLRDNKTFFLFNAERYKESNPQPGFTTVPTLLERMGDFSQSGVVIYNPLSTRPDPANPGRFIRDPYLGNIIPVAGSPGCGVTIACINPVGQAIINGFSLPNFGAPTLRFGNFYLSPGLGTDDFYSYIARVDHQFSERQSMFVRFVNNRRDQFQFGGNNRVGLGTDQQGPLVRENYGAVIDSLTTLSATAILNARLSFTRFAAVTMRQASSPFDTTSIGFSPAFTNARPVSIVPRIGFSDPAGGIAEFGSRNPNANITNSFSVPVFLTKIAGKHTLKFGGEYRRFQVNQSGGSFNFGGGAFCFTNAFSARDPQNLGATGGAAFADLLLGTPSASGGCSGNVSGTFLDNTSPTTFQSAYYAAFIQDDFKVTPKLTLNLGFRYDYEQPPTERFNRQNRGFAFDQANPLAAAVRNASTTDCPSCANLTGGLLFAGVGGQPEQAFERDLNNFQPRIGAAYQLNDKTVLRGGYGLYYFPSAEYGGASGFSVITPFTGTLPVTTTQPQNQFTPRADAFNNPFPNGLTQPTGSSLGQLTQLGTNITFTNPERDIPFIHQYSAGIQRELPYRLKLDVSYVGSRSRDILTGDAQSSGARNINVNSAEQIARFRQDPTFFNAPVTNPFAGLIPSNAGLNGATTARQNLLRPFPQFGSVAFVGENIGRLDYNSLQASLEKRLSRGLVGVVSYTFSKNIAALGFLNDQDAEPTRAIADFDSPHVLVASAVYQIPIGRGRRFLGDAGKATNLLLGGFEYNIIAQYRTGLPINLPGNADLIADPRIDNSEISNPNVANYSGSYFNNCVLQLNGTQLPIGSILNGSPVVANTTLPNGSMVFILPNNTSVQFVSNASGSRNNVRQTCTNPAFALRNTGNTLRTSPLRLSNLRQPSATVFDMSLNKSFIFTESIRAQFRVEAFNVFNTPLFGSPDTNVTGNNFGILNPNNGQRNIPRQIQLGFKFLF
ncbi:MAG: carboxypeptidase regulatory-like domain-containing protein [Pyrinomonadaceae bacterium MAG19_C2-C3]|nr:carboxypeptidase regulatory-like domain-containing protein [Pyrinomonadaceae bacterium MAG19_C2-C3]